MQRFFLYLLLLSACFSLPTCVEPFDFAPEAQRSVLVISGQLTSGEGSNLVELTRTFPFDRPRGKPVNGATVTVLDEVGNKGTYLPVFDGGYRLDKENFLVETGRSYTLVIELEGGKRYRSTPQIMPQAVSADSLSLAFGTEENINSSGGVTEQKIIQIAVNTPLPAQTFLRWEMDEYYDFTEFQCNPITPPKTCYIRVNEFEQLLELVGNAGGESRYLQQQPIANKPLLLSNTREFESRHYFNVYQYALTRSAFEFYQTAKEVTQQEGTIFDAPPAVVPGNLVSLDNETEQVRGVFEVAAVDTVRVSLTQAEVRREIVIEPFCQGFTQECCDCRRFPMSSTEQPEWF